MNIVNDQNQFVKISKGTTLGQIQPIDAVLGKEEIPHPPDIRKASLGKSVDSGTAESRDQEMTTHLQDTYERATKELG